MKKVRISGGFLHNLPIFVPESARPTTSRSRDVIFNTLGSFFLKNHILWSEISVLDCFAGSGLLGIEALSRGAKSADFIEKDKNGIEFLAKNLQNLQNTQIITGDFFKIEISKKYNLFFIDPPYFQNKLHEIMGKIPQNHAIFAIEVEKSSKYQPPQNMRIIKDKIIAHSRILIFHNIFD